MLTHAQYQQNAQIFFQLSYHWKPQKSLITNENIRSRLTYHCPSHWQALQRHTTTRSPPNIDINTCTGLWSQPLSVIHKQVRHSTDPSHTKNTDLMSSPRANNPPWTHLRDLFGAYWPGGHSRPHFFSVRRKYLHKIWAISFSLAHRSRDHNLYIFTRERLF